MQQITTKYLPPTNHRGARLQARATNGVRITMSYNECDELAQEQSGNSEIDFHIVCCKALLKKLQWHAVGLRMLIINAPDHNGYTFAFVDELRLVEFRNFSKCERPTHEIDIVSRPKI